MINFWTWHRNMLEMENMFWKFRLHRNYSDLTYNNISIVNNYLLEKYAACGVLLSHVSVPWIYLSNCGRHENVFTYFKEILLSLLLYFAILLFIMNSIEWHVIEILKVSNRWMRFLQEFNAILCFKIYFRISLLKVHLIK